MASSEQEKNIMKNRNSILHGDIFSWTFEICKQDMEISSDMFHFCGYCCYLKFRSFFSLWESKAFMLLFNISLHGYLSPCRRNTSCQYSLFMKNYEGKLYLNKSGEIHNSKDVINIFLCEDELDTISNVTICFSWLENGDYEVISQGTQTKPEISRNVFEQEPQTDEKWASQTLKFCSNSERTIPVLERGTQTEGACISPTSEFIDNAEKESFKFLQILSNDFGSLHERTSDPDCVLKVGEVKFPVHRTVLSARSTVFAAMFHHDTSESQSGEVEILDIDGDIFGDVLYYIYTGKIRGLSSSSAVLMYTVSDKYALIEFRDKCLNYLMLNLNVDNVGDAALLAHAHAEIQLENEIIQFIEENLEELMMNETWIRFSDTHSKLANKLLCSASIAIKKKFQKSHLS